MLKQPLILLAILVASIFPLEVFAQFFPEQIISREMQEMRVSKAVDLNGDGQLDALSSGVGGIVWSAGNGAGSFGAQQMVFYTSAYNPYFDVGDFDQDSDEDLVVYDNQNDRLLILRNNGEGLYTERTNIYEADLPTRRVVTGDMDNDGDMDVIVLTLSNSDSEKLLYFENEGNLTFADPEIIFEIEQGFTHIQIADFNADGFLDIIGMGAMGVAWLSGSATGDFAYNLIDDSTNFNIGDLDVKDLDSDGDLDIVVAGSSRFTVFLQNTLTGDFNITEYGENFSGLSSLRGVFAEDINGDGYAELFYVTYISDQTGYLVSSADGSYNARVIIDDDTDEGSDITLADFNQDGIADLFYVCFQGVRVAAGSADGIYASPVNILPNNPRFATGLGSMDVDNDGDLDVVCSYADFTEETEKKLLWYENINNEFKVQHFIDTNSEGVERMQLIDVDNDGFQDIVVTTRQTDRLQIYYNEGNSNFSNPNTIVENIKAPFYMQDFDGDDLPDLFYLDSNNSLRVRFRTGPTSFDLPDFMGVFTSLEHISSADMNGDGYLDLITTKYENSISYRLGAPNGAFGGTVFAINEVDGPRTTAAGDIDGDGALDLLVTSSQSDELKWFRNVSNSGEFEVMPVISEREFPNDSRLEDFDNDGDLDIVCNFYSNDGVVLFENAGDGTFSEIAQLSLPTDQIGNVLHTVDLDNNGGIDILAGFTFFEECKAVVYLNENTLPPSFTSAVAEVYCDDNGTPFNEDDDIIAFTLDVTGNYLGSTYSISAEGVSVTPTSAAYGTNPVFSLPAGSAGSGNILINVFDTENPDFSNTLVLNDPGICSMSASINASLSDYECLNNSTPTDPADDIIGFSLFVGGIGLSQEYTLHTEDYTVTPESAEYGELFTFELESGSAGNGSVDLQIRDAENPDIVANINLADPGTCSNLSSISDLLDNTFTISPNITNDVFTVNLPLESRGEVYVYSATQTTIYQREINGESQVEFSLNNKPAGVYFVTILTENGLSKMQRVIKY